MSDEPTWGIDTYWDAPISGPQLTAIRFHLEKLVILTVNAPDFEQLYTKVKMKLSERPNRFKVSVERTCSYPLAVISVPRDIVEAAHAVNIPLHNDMLIAIVVKEVGKDAF
jgi:hypothetical protein